MEIWITTLESNGHKHRKWILPSYDATYCDDVNADCVCREIKTSKWECPRTTILEPGTWAKHLEHELVNLLKRLQNKQRGLDDSFESWNAGFVLGWMFFVVVGWMVKWHKSATTTNQKGRRLLSVEWWWWWWCRVSSSREDCFDWLDRAVVVASVRARTELQCASDNTKQNTPFQRCSVE